MRKTILKTISFVLIVVLTIATIAPYNTVLPNTAIVYAASNTVENGYTVANNENELIQILTDNLYNKVYSIKIKLIGNEIDFQKVFELIMNDNAFLSCEVNSANAYYSVYENYVLYTFKINYLTTTEQDKETDKKINEILSEIITPDMYTYEKVKAVNDYIVSNYEYDLTYSNYSDYDLLFLGKSVCNGYALLAYKMFNVLNIPVVLVTGEADTGDGQGSEGHVWNMVNIGGYWFNLDVTWNDPTPDEKGSVSYNYYLKSDSAFSVDHTPDNAKAKPKTTKEFSVYMDDFNVNKDNYITTPTSKNINIKVHDSYIDFSKYDKTNAVEPFIENGRTLVPIRAVFTELGYDVDWDNSTNTATISNSTNILTIRPNDMYAIINDTKVSLDVPAKIVNDRIVVPVRFISEAFGNIVFWDNANQTVIIF